jgi:hypothetical protein
MLVEEKTFTLMVGKPEKFHYLGLLLLYLGKNFYQCIKD